ncbi:NADH-quinone oxidoreductase subunit NuoG [Buchnera aphidicola (Mollitrichosiphum nigrofasciatum)]|uniref:NADH-quinone oxidoreductase subunit NuoG n=1 Tax=Buchnera aphidicola TaxID=9 RepID=UPI0031B863C4
MVVIYIDKKSYNVSRKENLLQVCLSKGLDVPFFCWHPVLGSVGSCRQCAVKQYTMVDKNIKSSSIVMSCMTQITDRMIISTNNPEVIQFRKNIIELLMLNHPHDCPICAEGGNCHLQDMTVMTGHNNRRYKFSKKIYKNQYLGPFLTHEMNRCISCYRCVRFYNDYADGDDFGVYGANNKLYFGKLKSGDLESEYSGNLVEVCPTGVFSDKTHLHNFNRKWDMQYAPSVCHFCSIGCNISAAERYGELRRIENRYHESINKFFLCDLGRFGYDYNNILDRPKYITKINKIDMRILNFNDGIQLAVNLLKKSSKFIGIGSARSSIENNFALYNLVGKKNFSTGMSKIKNDSINFIIDVLQNSGLYVPTITEVEDYDCILIIGEDITQTAARLALAVRQAVKKKKINQAVANNIHIWNNYGINNFRNNARNFLFLTSNDVTRLDDIAEITYFDNFSNQILFIQSIINIISNKKYKINNFNSHIIHKINFIVKALLRSKKPLIISGMKNDEIIFLQLAVNVANILKKKNKDVGLILLPSFANGIGVSLMQGISLEEVFYNIKYKNVDSLIILENDLYYLVEKLKLDNVFNKIRNVIVLDHQNTHTVKKGTLIFPSASFFESSGTIINYEGRAQRFFQVYDPSYYNKDVGILESWRWLYYIHKKLYPNFLKWESLDDLLKTFFLFFPLFRDLKNISPNADVRFIGQKIARSPNRYSGRTVMRAHINEHEIHQPQDKDTIFSFSMEGIQHSWKYSSYIPFYWFPGWNSAQSWNKFNKYINYDKIYQNSGLLLFKEKKNNYNNLTYVYKNLFKKFKWRVVSYYRLFGSEEMSQKSHFIKQKLKTVFVKINFLDALDINIKNHDFLYFTCLNMEYCLKVFISRNLSRGSIGLPLGMFGLPHSLLGKEVTNVRRGKNL